jgi:ATP-binding cassette subfamily B protein
MHQSTTPLSAYRGLLETYLWPHRALLAWLTLLLLASIAVQVASPQLLGVFIDTALHGAPLQQLIVLAVVFLAASLVQQGLLIGATYFSERVAWTATNALRADLTRHCLQLDPSFHAEHTPGELIERIDGDVTAVASFFSQFVIQVLGNILLLLGILVMLWTFDLRVGLALSGFAAVALAVMLRTRALAVPAWVAFRQSSARLFGFIEELLNGLEDVRSLGADRFVLHRLGLSAGDRLRTARRARLLSSIPWSMPIVFSAIGIALTYGLSAVMVGAGALTIGAAFTLYFYARLLFLPLNRISGQLEEFQRASAGIVRIEQLRSWSSAIVDPLMPQALSNGPLSVAFEHVDFAYRVDEPVLRDVTFSLPAGQTLGLVGRTGSGKTTITRLLVRLWDPAAGSVQVGDRDVRHVSRAALRQRVGLVTQQPHLFDASVRDNLTLFDASVTDAQLQYALGELGIAGWVHALPDGLETRLGADGRGLSAGEAQLLALGRVFLRDPGLVLFDEPSSRLDPATERLVDSAIHRLLWRRTGLIVAHRLGTLDRVDAVLVLDEGRVVEQGPRHALATDDGSRFARLLRVGLEPFEPERAPG